jgi:hypothetical protein
MTETEQYAHDLVAVIAQRPDALSIARCAVRKLERREGLRACDVCGKGYRMGKKAKHQRYCSVKCRERHQYVTYKQGKPR